MPCNHRIRFWSGFFSLKKKRVAKCRICGTELSWGKSGVAKAIGFLGGFFLAFATGRLTSEVDTAWAFAGCLLACFCIGGVLDAVIDFFLARPDKELNSDDHAHN